MKDPRIDKLPKWAQSLIAQKDGEIERIGLELAAIKTVQSVSPDLMPPENFGELIKGWHYTVWGNSFRVEPACTSSISHSIGDTYRARSQNSKPLYSTRLRALQAALYELEQQHTKTVIEIQKKIEKEKVNPTPIP